MTSQTPTSADLPVVESLQQLCDLVAPDAFVRFSKGPHDDADSTSRDYESGLDLPGLSVNPLKPEDWWTRPLDEWLARQICNYVHIAEESDDERRAWVLTGRVASRGPDNEPLVDDYEPVAWLSDAVLEEAKRLYEERFDVSSDSTD
ncbi:MAG TPA: DUF6098 family protein [Cryptosporangiaceae bacterium]|nr:DUF6098 family protein [Cryptosporangiaceae bacterium]